MKHLHIRPLVSWRAHCAGRPGFVQFKAPEDIAEAMHIATVTTGGEITKLYRATKRGGCAASVAAAHIDEADGVAA